MNTKPARQHPAPRALTPVQKSTLRDLLVSVSSSLGARDRYGKMIRSIISTLGPG